jgi:exopolyphosphatase/pppGpp-phosphohydrolase
MDWARPFRSDETGVLVRAHAITLHSGLETLIKDAPATLRPRGKRVAAIEVGSGATRLQIMDIGTELRRDVGSEQTRLNLLDDAFLDQPTLAVAKLDRILTAYKAKAALAGAEAIRVIGTAGARLLARRTSMLAGLGVEILSEEEEAHLSFIGAMSGWQCQPDGQDILVIDQGQGSLELAEGTNSPARRVKRTTSLPLGAKAVSEISHRSGNPQSPLCEQMRSILSSWLANSAGQRGACAAVIGSTATRLGWEAVKRSPREKYAKEKVHGATFDLERLRYSLERIRSHTRVSCQTGQIADLTISRDACFTTNLRLICEIASLAGVREIRVSTTGTRQGALLEMANV